MTLTRDKRIRIYGSKNFTQQPIIAAGGRFNYNPSPTAAVAKYRPLDYIQVKNNSDSLLKLKLNGSSDRVHYIESGTIESWDKSDIQPFSSYVLEEVSGNAVSQEDVNVSVKRMPMDSDKQAMEQAQKGPAEKLVENTLGFNPMKVFGGGR